MIQFYLAWQFWRKRYRINWNLIAPGAGTIQTILCLFHATWIFSMNDLISKSLADLFQLKLPPSALPTNSLLSLPHSPPPSLFPELKIV